MKDFYLDSFYIWSTLQAKRFQQRILEEKQPEIFVFVYSNLWKRLENQEIIFATEILIFRIHVLNTQITKFYWIAIKY